VESSFRPLILLLEFLIQILYSFLSYFIKFNFIFPLKTFCLFFYIVLALNFVTKMSFFAQDLIYENDTSQSGSDAEFSIGHFSSVSHPLRSSNSNSKITISISNPTSGGTSPRGNTLKSKHVHSNIWSTAPLPFRQIPSSNSSSSHTNNYSSLFSSFPLSHEDVSPSYESIASTISHSPTCSPFSSFSSTSSPALSPSNETAEEFNFSTTSLSVKVPNHTSRRRHSDGIPVASKFGAIAPSMNSNNNVIIHDSSNSHYYSGTNSLSASPSRTEVLVPEIALIDPRTRDPERLAALLAIVLHMELSGMQPKLLSQLGIMYKQMYPHLFVKGLLKDMIEHAVNAQLLKLTGPAGQQQVHLSSKARQLSRLNQLTHVGQIASVIPALISALSNSSIMQGSYGSTPPQSPPATKNNQFVYSFEESDDPVIISGGRKSSIHSGLSFENPILNTEATTLSRERSATNMFDPFSPSHAIDNTANMIPEEKIFQHEKINHLKYIYHFRVHPCRAYANKQCAAENKKNSSECFEYHSTKMRRRVLRVLQYSNGWFWSYNACRCTAIEKDQKCEKGDSCRYAHNKEEIAYHPSRYKTQACAYPTDASGVCIRFGMHCAFAHGDDDLRKPIVLQQGLPHMLIDDGYSGSALFSKLAHPSSVNMTLSPDDYASFRDVSWTDTASLASKTKSKSDTFNNSLMAPIQNHSTNNTTISFSHNGVNLSGISSTMPSLLKDNSFANPPLLKSVFPYSLDSDYDKWSFDTFKNVS
jgi:hypothetical protein